MTPIAALVRMSPSTATISTPSTADSKDYVPSAVTDFVPGVPVTKDVVGVYYRDKSTGQDGARVVNFTFTATEPPAYITPEKSTCLVNGVLYTIALVRERWWRGAIDGYTLDLRK
jgi:hypothetical protein